jgi:hypothetical protein
MKYLDDLLKTIAAILYAFAVLDIFSSLFLHFDITRVWWSPLVSIVVATILLRIVYKMDVKKNEYHHLK